MSILGLGIILLAALLVLAYLAVLAFAIVQIFRTPELAVAERWIWAFIIVAFPFLGSIVWFVAGPHPFGLRLPQGQPEHTAPR